MRTTTTIMNLFRASVIVVGATSIASAQSEVTIVGRFLRCQDDRIQVTDTKGQTHTLLVSLEVRVTCDGEQCTVSDLKSGMKVRVTSSKTDKALAAEIEAIEKHNAFTNVLNGKLTAITGKTLKMIDSQAKVHSFELSKNCTYTLDENSCQLADLSSGMEIQVTNAKLDKSIAVRIDAFRPVPDFRPDVPILSLNERTW